MAKTILVIICSIVVFFIFGLITFSYKASNDLLNAFVQLEKGVGETVSNFESKNSKLYSLINRNSGAKIVSDSIRVKANRAVNYIDNIKYLLVYQSEGNIDNQVVGFDIIYNQGIGNNMLFLIADFRDFILENIQDSSTVDFMKSSLNLQPQYFDGDSVEFLRVIAEHLPMASVSANLTLYQSYIRNGEAITISYLASSITHAPFEYPIVVLDSLN
tara:strand:- start:122 stop:769 length:648 start_codon:yes stop_codon:yes gene_type:complete